LFHNASRAATVVTIATCIGIATPAHDAQAAFVAASNGSGGFLNTFEVTDTVFAFGDMNKVADPGPLGFGLAAPTARIYVMANQEWSGFETLIDVTNDGINNVTGLFSSGFFSDVALWTAPLPPGLYDIILDEKKNGRFDPINDTVMDLGLSGEFLVAAPGGSPIPIPATFPLLISALGALVMAGRRQT